MTNVIGPVTDPLDPWAMISGNQYDIDTIYTRSTDGKGHSVNIQAPLSTNVHGQVAAIVGLEDTKYRSVQDFVRDAVAHRLRYWQEVMQSGRLRMLPGVEEMLATEAVMTAIADSRTRRTAARSAMTDSEKEISELISAGLLDEAQDLVDLLDVAMEHWQYQPGFAEMQDTMTRIRSNLIRARQQRNGN